MSTTLKSQTVSALLTAGWTPAPTRSSWVALSHPSQSLLLFVGHGGALRLGRNRTNSRSIRRTHPLVRNALLTPTLSAPAEPPAESPAESLDNLTTF